METNKKCPQCGYPVGDPRLQRCPRCCALLVQLPMCSGNCRRCTGRQCGK